jgi:hypothetical protein
MGGEEVTVIRSVLASGGVGYWVPAADVQHWIPRSRQTVGYFRAYFQAQGYQLERSFNENGMMVGNAPPWLWRMWVESEIAFLIHRILSGPRVWTRALINASETKGILMRRLKPALPKDAGKAS